MSGRQSIRKSIRFSVFKRDGFSCQYCGAHPPTAILEVDHIIAVVNGGTNDETNLVTACLNCNRGKGAIPLSDVPRSLSDRAGEVAEREEQVAGYEATMRARRDRIEADSEIVLGKIFELFSKMESVPRQNFISIKRFVEQIGLESVLDAVEISFHQGPDYYEKWFRYFCGVCWRKIRDEAS